MERPSADVPEGTEAVVVMLGANAFEKYTDSGRLRQIADRHSGKVVFKPHPNYGHPSTSKVKGVVPDAVFMNPLADLYEIIAKVDLVYASHCSESVLISMIDGKRVEPTDGFDMRLCGGYSHINNILFSSCDGLVEIDKIFASPKSGVICPEVDKDWRKKIDDYMAYIMTCRERQKGFYV